MTRLIDADALQEEFVKTWGKRLLLIDLAPTVELPKGKWNLISLRRDCVYVRCSECGQVTRLVRDSKNEFCCIKDVRDKIISCPYCGANMREGD